jgi:peptide/nickel transport system permease protein
MAALWKLFRAMLAWAASLALAALLAAMLICWAPGAGIDEAELDSRFSGAAVQALRQERAEDRSVPGLLRTLTQGLLAGDFGHSTSLNRPVAEILAERLPVTAAVTAAGWALAWLAGFALALAGLGGAKLRLVPLALASFMVSAPVAVAALGCAYAGWPPAAAVAFAVAPKIFSYADRILQRGLAESHRLAALARGVRPPRLLWAHLLLPALPEFRALAGVTVPLALGASIPVEVFTGTPGLGELAWKAAMGRDVVLLLWLTLLLTGVTLAVSGRASGDAQTPEHHPEHHSGNHAALPAQGGAHA